MQDHNNLKILVTGAGLIGGTLALDYSQKLSDAEITVYDIDENAAHNLRSQLAEKSI